MFLFPHLALVKDNHPTINQYHNLVDVLFLIISAVKSGGEGGKILKYMGKVRLTG